MRLKNGLLLYLIPPGTQVCVKLKNSFTSKLSHTLGKQFHFESLAHPNQDDNVKLKKTNDLGIVSSLKQDEGVKLK